MSVSEYDKWAGWAAGGAVLMIMLGVFRAISGFIALFNDEWIIRGFDGYYFVDISALGWWMLAVGALLILAGLSIVAGQTWGRIVGVVFVMLALVSEFMWLPVYPFWSIISIVLYTVILYAFLVVRGPASR